MSKAKAMRWNKAARESLDGFEVALRRVHPELATPLSYGELQGASLSLIAVTRRCLRKHRQIWTAIERLQKRMRQLERRAKR